MPKKRVSWRGSGGTGPLTRWFWGVEGNQLKCTGKNFLLNGRGQEDVRISNERTGRVQVCWAFLPLQSGEKVGTSPRYGVSFRVTGL